MFRSSFDVKLREKRESRASDIFILDGKPLSNVEQMIPLSLNRLYLGMFHILQVCVFIYSWRVGRKGVAQSKRHVLNSE